MSTPLTVCSVSFGEAPMLRLGLELTRRLNPGADLRWRLVRNQPVQPADAAPGLEEDFEVVDGAFPPAEGQHAFKRVRSHHHALGLNAGTNDLGTRYVLLLDPDCFIVRPGWIADVLEHMERHGLATFGTPYHPRTLAKIRYVPCAVCMFFDTERLDLAGLDWSPGTPVVEDDRPPAGILDRLVRAYLRRSGDRLRLRLGSSVDTGIEVYRRHDEQRLATDCVQPVMLPTHLRAALKPPRERVLEAALPDRYCVLPRRKGYLADRGFAAHGHEDTARMGCEEYMWRDAPFALHLRGGPAELREDLGAVERLLEQFSPAPRSALP